MCTTPSPVLFCKKSRGTKRPWYWLFEKDTPVPRRFPFNKNFGLKIRKFHVPNGTVHSGFTDPFQATGCLLIVPAASRIQKSGTGDNNFVKWKAFRSDRPKWVDWSKWTTFKGGPKYSVWDRTEIQEMVRSIWFLTKSCGYLSWMETAPEKLGAINLWCMKSDIKFHA